MLGRGGTAVFHVSGILGVPSHFAYQRVAEYGNRVAIKWVIFYVSSALNSISTGAPVGEAPSVHSAPLKYEKRGNWS